jgi:hypothetical protein
MRATRTAGTGRSRAWWALAAAALVTAGVFVGAGSWAGAPGTPSTTAGGSPSGPAVAPASGGLSATNPSPASADIDPSESVALTGSASGGTSPYSYEWYSGTYPECSADVQNGAPFGTGYEVNVSSTLPSSYYCYAVTDSEQPPVTVTPTSATLVTVEGTLVAGAPGPGPLTIDSGKSITLSSSPYGGLGPYRIAWTSNATGTSSCLISSVPSMPVAPTQNTSYCYTVTDSSQGLPPASATSPALAITVDPKLVAGPVSPAAPTLDSGTTIALTAAPSGGTGAGTYTVQWYAGTSTSCPTGKAVGTNTTSYTPPPLASTTSYCYSITDTSYGSTAVYSAVDTVTVKAGLTAGPVGPASPGVDSGQSIVLSADPGAGDPPYFLQWYYSTFSTCSSTTATPVVGQTNPTYTLTPGLSEYLCYSVSDSSASPPTVFSAGDLVTVNPPPSAGAIGPVSPTIDSGQYIGLTANPSGGTPAYLYSWYSGLNASCAGDTTTLGNVTRAIEVDPSSTTFYCYKVSDSSKGTPAQTALSGTDEVSVNTALKASAITPASPTIDGGQSITLTANPSGGTPVYSFRWYTTTSTCTATTATAIAGQTNTTLLTDPSANTTYCYSVTDGSANPPTRFSALDPVTVEKALTPGTIASGDLYLDLGQSLTLTAMAKGGKSPYSYTWYSGSSAECADDTTVAGTVATLTITPGASTYYCYVVTDSLSPPGRVNSTAALVVVDPVLSAHAILSVSTVIDKGESATLVAHPAGGTPAYQEQWYTGTSSNCTNDTTKLGLTTGTQYNLTVKPSTTGPAYFCYTATDASTGTPAASATAAAYLLTVNAALVIGAPTALVDKSVTQGPVTVTQGQTVELRSNASGGTPVLTYAWYESPTSKCAANSTRIHGADLATYNFTASTSAYYCVEISDGSTGVPGPPFFSPAEQVTVNPPPGPTFLGFPAVEGYAILGGLLGFCALVGFLVYLRIRGERGRKGPTSDFL